MPTYRVTDPSTGKTIRVTGDSPPTEIELGTIFADLSTRPAEKVQEVAPVERGAVGKAWDALALPEKLAREGLGKMASMVPQYEPTGNKIKDVALNIPRVAAETVAEAAPGFISREAIVTAGALKGVKLASPILKAIGRQVAKGAEAISGLEYKTPGVLSEAAKDASLIFSKGTKRVGQMYLDAIDKAKIRPSFGRATTPKELLDEAMAALDSGTLTPEEALIARQTLDGIKKSVPRYSFYKMRDAFDGLAKTISAEADRAFSRGVKADALRNLFPQNKLGGTSIAKSALGTIAGAAPLAAMSPMVQGSIATGVGVAARGMRPFVNAPVKTGMAAAQISALSKLRKQRKKEQE